MTGHQHPSHESAEEQSPGEGDAPEIPSARRRDDVRPWLLYGAYGYTGRLLAMEALRRGHRPILAGRREEPLQALAHELEGRTPRGLARELGHPEAVAHRREAEHAPGVDPEAPLPRSEWRRFSLDHPGTLRRELEGVSAVLHAAGPFLHTAPPMLEACLEVGAHYLDITGEVPVFERAFGLHQRARDAGVVLLPGVGMDVVPTDAAAGLLAEALPTGRRLELAIHSPGGPSAGTLKTIVDGLPGGLLVRRDGRLEGASPGRREFRREVDFGPEPQEGPMAGRLGGRRSVAPYTWGDLATAWRTTGVGHVTCYMTTSRWQVRLLPVALPLLRAAMSVGPVRRLARRAADRGPAGPSLEHRRTGRTRVWGRMEDDERRWSEVVLELPQGYRFTAVAGVRALEEVLARPGLRGAVTPAGAFGHGWVLGLPELEVVERRGFGG